MNPNGKAGSCLERLLSLREQQLERLGAEVAAKQVLRSRVNGTVERLEQLCESAGASAGLRPVLSANCGDYKASIMELAATQRASLAAHDADLATLRLSVAEAAKRQEALAQLLERRSAELHRSQQVRDQRRQDEVASQMWMRGRS
ncbi:MAG TPA: flagellar FliJ family protein [Burkholderiaceae bacterium]|nr:flagellar FliJ family protein [Burkholderiaceae bacterium]